MIGFVVFSLRRAWQGFWRNALMSIAATATMVLMLVLLAGFWILQTGLLSALDFTEQKVEVTANVQMTATPAEIAALQARIQALPQAPRQIYVTHGEPVAADSLRQAIEERLGWPCRVPEYRDVADL